MSKHKEYIGKKYLGVWYKPWTWFSYEDVYKEYWNMDEDLTKEETIVFINELMGNLKDETKKNTTS